MTEDGRLKILDFGLAKLRLPVAATAVTESLSETEAMAGTLPYMAPEQLLGGDVDARTDIHAAGAVLYEMATGKNPFAEVEMSELIGAILHRSPHSVTSRGVRVSSELERIFAKCLEKEPENRYQSAKEVAVDLRRVARQKEAGGPQLQPPIASHFAKLGRYKTGVAIIVSATILIAMAGFFLRTWVKPSSDAARMRGPECGSRRNS